MQFKEQKPGFERRTVQPVTNLYILYTTRTHFLASAATVSFSRRTLFRGVISVAYDNADVTRFPLKVHGFTISVYRKA